MNPKVLEGIAVVVIMGGIIGTVIYAARRKRGTIRKYFPFVYATISFFIWLSVSGADKSLLEMLTAVIVLNGVVGLLLWVAIREIRR
jgi:hypothetical protein